MSTIVKEEIFELHSGLIGRKIECTINIYNKTEARVQRQVSTYYICQNVISGSTCIDKLGYKYSWQVGDGTKRSLAQNGVTNIKIIVPEWDNENN